MKFLNNEVEEKMNSLKFLCGDLDFLNNLKLSDEHSQIIYNLDEVSIKLNKCPNGEIIISDIYRNTLYAK